MNIIADTTHTDTLTIDTLAAFGPRVSMVKSFEEWDIRNEGYFAHNEYFHPERGLSKHGVAGDPLPYATSRDDNIGTLLLICFIAIIIGIHFSRNLLLRQIKNFFYVPRMVAEMSVTTQERNATNLLLLATTVIMAIGCCLCWPPTMQQTQLSVRPFLYIAAYALPIAASFLLRQLMYAFVNWVFFFDKKIEQSKRAWIFLINGEGIFIFILILLHVYAALPLQNVLLASSFVIILAKILTFYKYKTIFFKGLDGFLQNILYFCALELMPLTALGGTLMIMNNYLDILF